MNLDTLRTVLAELKAAEPARRWERALSVLVQCRVQAALSGARGWWVQSECEPSKEYWVCHLPCDVCTCTCQVFAHRGGPCKHALAVRLLQAWEQAEAENQAAEPIPLRTRAYAESDRFELTPKGEAYRVGVVGAPDDGPGAA